MDFLKKLEVTYPNIAYIYAVLGYSFQAIMQIIFKYITRVISPFHALFMRAFCLFFFNCFVLNKANESPYIGSPFVFRQILKRIVFSSSYGVLIHYCVKYLPVSTVSTLSNTGPIFIFFIEALYYKKPLNKISLILTCLSFIGVILIIQPQFLFSKGPSLQIQHFQFLSFLVIIAALCFSMTMIYIHDTAKSITNIVNLHYSYIGHMILTSILANFDAPHIDIYSIKFSFCLAFVGVVVFALFTQYMLFAATSLKKPSYTMPFGYVAIIVSFTADLLIFDIKFNLLQVVGILLTSVGLLSKYIVGQQHQGKSQKVKSDLDEIQEERISRQQQFQKL